MRILVLTFSMLAFLFSCFVGTGHVHAVEMQHDDVSSEYVHTHDHHSDDLKNLDVTGVQDEEETQGPCECCTHSHCVALLFSQLKVSVFQIKPVPSWYMESHYSTDPFRLKRPPRG